MSLHKLGSSRLRFRMPHSPCRVHQLLRRRAFWRRQIKFWDWLPPFEILEGYNSRRERQPLSRSGKHLASVGRGPNGS
jgi:hypothetical protein